MVAIAGTPVWHNIITSPDPGAPGNAAAWSDPLTQVKDCLNFLKQRFTPFPDELLGAQNWDEGIAIGNCVATTEAIAVCELDAYNVNTGGPVWTGGRRIFVANGNLVFSSARGTKWSQEVPAGAPPTFTCIAASNGAAAGNVMAAGNTNVLEFWTGAARVWSTITSPRTAHTSMVWQNQMDRFLIACTDGGGNPHVIAYDHTGASPGDVAMPIPGGYLGHLSSSFMPIATKGQIASIVPGLTIACNGDTDGTVDIAFYHTPNATFGAAWILTQPHLTTQSPAHSFFYDDSRGLFYLVTQDGHAYSTADAVTFIDLGYTIPVTVVGFGGVANLNTISVRGSFWFLSTEQGSLLFSTDAGATWTQVPAPFIGNVLDFQQYPMQRTFALVDRFCVVARALTNGTPHQISFSKRLRAVS